MLEGLHPNRPTHVFRLTTDERSARVMTELIGEIFDPAETAVASFETEDGGPWLLEAYFARSRTRRRSATSCAPLSARKPTRACFCR